MSTCLARRQPHVLPMLAPCPGNLPRCRRPSNLARLAPPLSSFHQIFFSDGLAARPSQEELRAGEDIARCPSCSLYVVVVYNPEDLPDPAAPADKGPSAGEPVAVN